MFCSTSKPFLGRLWLGSLRGRENGGSSRLLQLPNPNWGSELLPFSSLGPGTCETICINQHTTDQSLDFDQPQWEQQQVRDIPTVPLSAQVQDNLWFCIIQMIPPMTSIHTVAHTTLQLLSRTFPKVEPAGFYVAPYGLCTLCARDFSHYNLIPQGGRPVAGATGRRAYAHLAFAERWPHCVKLPLCSRLF